MKRAFFLVAALVGISFGAAETVTNFAELEAAVHDNASTPIYLNGPTFTLTEDLIVDHACNISNIYGDTVTIDGGDAYKVFFSDNTTINSAAICDVNRIVFTQGDDSTVFFNSPASPKTLTAYYCDFNDAATSAGLATDNNNDTTINLYLYYCNFQGNVNEGVSLSADSGTQVVHAANCTFLDNIGLSSNGISTHASGHKVYMEDCTLSGNSVGGLNLSGGGQAWVTDCNFYSNLSDQIVMAENAQLFITGGYIWNLASTSIGINANFANAVLVCDEVTFDVGSGVGTCYQHIKHASSTLLSVITRCKFIGLIGGNAPAVTYGGNAFGLFANNTIYGPMRGIATAGTKLAIYNNIISNCGQYGLLQTTANDYTAAQTGYNCFFNNVADFYLVASYADTDFQSTDPRFVDAAQKDFRLKATSSPLINAGLHGSDIGAEEPENIVTIRPRRLQ